MCALNGQLKVVVGDPNKIGRELLNGIVVVVAAVAGGIQFDSFTECCLGLTVGLIHIQL